VEEFHQSSNVGSFEIISPNSLWPTQQKPNSANAKVYSIIHAIFICCCRKTGYKKRCCVTGNHEM